MTAVKKKLARLHPSQSASIYKVAETVNDLTIEADRLMNDYVNALDVSEELKLMIVARACNMLALKAALNVSYHCDALEDKANRKTK